VATTTGKGGGDTSLGGLSKEFPKTTNGLLQDIRSASRPLHPDDLEKLVRRYWKPVYFFIRLTTAGSNEDSKDLTQSFFTWIFEKDVLKKYQSERAPFRVFLKAVLRRYLSDHRKTAGRLKRGKEATFVRFEEDDPLLEEILKDPQSDPEKVFDQAWMIALVRQAVERLRQRLSEEGRMAQFQVFQEHDLSESGRTPSYAELAQRLGIKETQVRDTLVAMRQQFRTEIRAELARQTQNSEELEEEWHALMGS